MEEILAPSDRWCSVDLYLDGETYYMKFFSHVYVYRCSSPSLKVLLGHNMDLANKLIIKR